ncbi:related to bifunctional 4-hydroxyphenylacetate degradation enzyme [Phialocephala subalpina]|uniref:Related to bifunctional 4-hydroxyphenylacetate degradation enzyme n=1 Tax=Phialocephala subalpina TaxID=576137 RepID=A0A1L7WUT2_9HELO|nr:related to bifunctional 4-hydroxyphenylacetate degradation enzyme [Phialocephala subalpina]
MSTFSRLIKFVASEDNKIYFADAGVSDTIEAGNKFDGYPSIEALDLKSGGRKVSVSQLLAPTPTESNPIYCVGLNFAPHVKEAGMTVPLAPPIWLKPARAWANPGETIPFSKWTAENFPDYEAWQTNDFRSGEARDVSVADANDYILGYTIGNDLTARVHQDPPRSGWQFGYSKGFDKFAPIGPYLVPPSKFSIKESSVQTRINGALRQNSPLDLIFGPQDVLSFISQSTTIPAGTAIMTGTPGGVGWFAKPQVSLKDGDEMEVTITGLGVLKNKVKFV